MRDRKRSIGHLAIPLVSSDLVGRMPLVASLFDQLGVGLDWLEDPRAGTIREIGQRAEQQFFVDDISKLLVGRHETKAVGGKRVMQSKLRCGPRKKTTSTRRARTSPAGKRSSRSSTAR